MAIFNGYVSLPEGICSDHIEKTYIIFVVPRLS